ncbi:MAG: autotransporter-associated beta strand repeat-containing protein, partial [Chthoniobacter sp.]|nr:autotransporter-associated beta strand repeat-containing protein [Chthoniobacter sp.]
MEKPASSAPAKASRPKPSSILTASIAHRLRCVPALVCAVAAGFAVPKEACAATLVWNAGTSDWFTGSNWTPAGPPTSVDAGVIDNGGTAQIGASGAVAGAVVVGSTASGTLQITAGGSLQLNGSLNIAQSSGASTGSVTVSGANANLAGQVIEVGETGTGSLTIANGGTVATPEYLEMGGSGGTGTVNLNTGGTLQVSGTDGIRVGTGTGIFNFAGGTLQVGASDLTTSVNMTLANATNSTVDTNGLNATLSGVLSGGGALTKTGTGTLTLSNSGNNYTGGTTINGGTVSISNDGNLGDSTGGVKLDGGTLQATAGLTTNRTITLGASGGTIATVGDTQLYLAGKITGSGALSLSSPSVGGAAIFLTGTVDNDFTGLTTIQQGYVELAAAGHIALSGDVQINSGAILSINTDEQIADAATVTNNGFLTFFAAANVKETIGTLNGNGEVYNSGSSGIGTLAVGAGTFTGTIIDGVTGGTVALIKQGAGTLTLTGGNTFSGGTEISGGILQLGDGTTTGASLGSGDVTIDSGGTLTLDLAGGETFSNNVTDNGHIIADDGVFANYTISSTITGTGDFTKTGSNTVTLTGNNTYQGGTAVNGGTLLVNNTAGSGTGSGPVAVNAGGTLGGSGTVGGAVTLNSGGFIAPGAGTPGVAGTTLHANSLTWNGGGTLTLQLGATSDQLALTGALTKGSGTGFNINLLNAGIDHPDYTLATFNGTTFTAGDFTLTLPAGYTLGALVETATELDLILAFAASGSVIQNSAPVGTPYFADFTVNGQVTTGGPNDNNVIHSLIFTPGSSLLIHNTLYVTQGPVVLVGGSTLTLDGSLSASQLQMLFGSLLNGNGSIIGDLINAGLLSPGHSPGHIQVSGNYTQTPTGTLKIEIGGRDVSQHDLLTVGGTATLGGTLQLVRLDKFKLKRNEPVTFLTANGGVSGRFSMVENGFTSDTILQPTVVYHQDSVALQAVQGSFETFAQNSGLTFNQRSVAQALDSVAFNRKADALINYLDYRKLNKLP